MDFIKKISAVNWIKIAVIVIILTGVIVYISQKKTINVVNTNTIATTTITKSTSSTKTAPAVAKNVMNKCNFRVTSPVIYSSVNVPFTVKGIVDKTDTKEGCMWNTNDPAAGYAEIFYNKSNSGWTTSGTSVPIMLTGIPGTPTTTLAFSIPFTLYAQALGLKSGTPIKIVFTEFNIPKQANPDTFDFLVYLK